MSKRALDRDRFAKCQALMDRGATHGERAAAKAAAVRVAAAAGLSLAEAISLVDAHRLRPDPNAAHQPDRGRRPYARPTYPWAQPQPRSGPITVEELLRQREAAFAMKKKAVDREQKRPVRRDPEQERWAAEARGAQALRDREWAEQRKQRDEAQP